MSDVILIDNREARILVLTYGTGKEAKPLRLNVGTNAVPRHVWEQLQDTRMVLKRLDDERLIVLDDKADLGAMPVTRAVARVAGTFDVAELEKWRDTETRTPVLAAIDQQLERLDGSKPDTDDGASDDIAATSPVRAPATMASDGVDVSGPRTRARRRRK